MTRDEQLAAINGLLRLGEMNRHMFMAPEILREGYKLRDSFSAPTVVREYLCSRCGGMHPLEIACPAPDEVRSSVDADVAALASPAPQPADFVECATCRAKPGSPVLCDDCLRRRAAAATAPERDALDTLVDLYLSKPATPPQFLCVYALGCVRDKTCADRCTLEPSVRVEPRCEPIVTGDPNVRVELTDAPVAVKMPRGRYRSAQEAEAAADVNFCNIVVHADGSADLTSSVPQPAVSAPALAEPPPAVCTCNYPYLKAHNVLSGWRHKTHAPHCALYEGPSTEHVVEHVSTVEQQLAGLREWKATQQSFLMAASVELLAAGFKGDGVLDGIKWLAARASSYCERCGHHHKRGEVCGFHQCGCLGHGEGA